MADFQSVIDAGTKIAEPKVAGAGLYAVVPEGAELKSLEEYLAAPPRVRAKVEILDQASFVDYFNRFKGPGSAIFANRQGFSFAAVIDYHRPAGIGSDPAPAFGSHRLAYSCPRSKEWQTWTGYNDKPMSQADFALFIENNIVDIRSPPAAEMLEAARSLSAKKKVEFVSDIRLADGARSFTYNETVDGVTSKGRLQLPETFTLGIPVFFGGQPYEVTARLRYRIPEGKLSLWYSLYRHEYIEQDAFATIGGQIQQQTETTIWQGVAP